MERDVVRDFFFELGWLVWFLSNSVSVEAWGSLPFFLCRLFSVNSFEGERRFRNVWNHYTRTLFQLDQVNSFEAPWTSRVGLWTLRAHATWSTRLSCPGTCILASALGTLDGAKFQVCRLGFNTAKMCLGTHYQSSVSASRWRNRHTSTRVEFISPRCGDNL